MRVSARPGSSIRQHASGRHLQLAADDQCTPSGARSPSCTMLSKACIVPVQCPDCFAVMCKQHVLCKLHVYATSQCVVLHTVKKLQWIGAACATCRVMCSAVLICSHGSAEHIQACRLTGCELDLLLYSPASRQEDPLAVHSSPMLTGCRQQPSRCDRCLGPWRLHSLRKSPCSQSCFRE